MKFHPRPKRPADPSAPRFRDDREDDQRILDALYLRDNGWPAHAIAKRLGFAGATSVRGKFSRIKADLEASEA